MSIPAVNLFQQAIIPTAVVIVGDASDLFDGPQYTLTVTDTASHVLVAADPLGLARARTTDLTIINQGATASLFKLLSGTTVIWNDAIAGGAGQRVSIPDTFSTAGQALNIQFATAGTFAVNGNGLLI